jgi:hypothetical protein
MSDFLRTLAARAEGRLPVLERRPRALFEAAPGAAAIDEGQPTRGTVAVDEVQPARGAVPVDEVQPARGAVPVDEVQPARGAVAVDEVQRRGMVTPSPTRLAPGEADESQAASRHGEGLLTTTAHAAPEGIPRRSGRDDSAPRQATPQRGLLQPEPSVPVAHQVLSGVQARDALPAMPRISAPASPAALAAARVVNAGTRSRDETPEQRSRSDSRNGDADGTPQAKPNERNGAPTIGPLHPQPMQAARPAVLVARQQSKATPRRDAPASTALAAPAPVQISIGRIEIRATSNASADRPRAVGPTAPRLSLDDYLRSRNGASR